MTDFFIWFALRKIGSSLKKTKVHDTVHCEDQKDADRSLTDRLV